MRITAIAAAAAIIVGVLLVAAPPSQAAENCRQVNAALAPCVRYLIGHGGSAPSPACCSGVRAVKEMAAADKRGCCRCIKAVADRYPNMKDDVALGLPAKCGVETDIPISRAMDCERIN
ncbi:non-specific lipid-transfer protein 1-like [Andrographis paniculata]|uniref:non-specific lipid-transfer protein 1-like n=1 Tax=Andrographis paniculata TaxID=175694 RepID=UPI0021E8F13A|nr:non-specific lipid-transfer protein 1-like [Andrographis paniculata]